MDEQRAWWKEAVVYEVYPQSFNDSNGDGIGDIPGLIEKLDYLEELGIDVVWLCPMFESPEVDEGYDISDYRSVADKYGSMTDMEELIEELHDREMRLILDLVVNHTSDRHPWFEASRSSTDNDYREYYIWRPGESSDSDGSGEASGEGESSEAGEEAGPGDPPNNWDAYFEGSVWAYDDRTEEWYLHTFYEQQPDLNWENPEVRADVYELTRWWLEKGVDGFRMDAICFLSKEEGLPDGEPDPVRTGREHYMNHPGVHEYLSEMSAEVLSEYEAVSVPETPGATVEQALEYVGEGGDGLDMVIEFETINVDNGPGGKWDIVDWSLSDLKEIITRWQEGLTEGGGWQSLYLSNHDQPRMVSRFGSEEYRKESATALATLLFTLRGTPFVYQGEEIGMTNVEFESLEEVQDIETIQHVEARIENDDAEDFEDMKEAVYQRSRDNARTPMQWNSNANAGFTDGEPWIKLNPNYTEVNLERERADGNSVLQYYQDLIDLRHDHDVLVYGEYDLLYPDHEEIYAYTRTLEPMDDTGEGEENGENSGDAGTGIERVLVVLNLSEGTPTFERPGDLPSGGDLLIGNYGVDPAADDDAFELRPYEARVYRLPS
jgi:glycosidase